MTETAHQLTMQEAFDKAALAVLEQGMPSELVGTCLYISHAADGSELHCGIGFLLPSNEMCEYWDNNEWTMMSLLDKDLEDSIQLEWEKDLQDTGLNNLHPRFLLELQNAHDNCIELTGDTFRYQFRRRMLRVAKNYGLTVPFETSDLEEVVE